MVTLDIGMHYSLKMVLWKIIFLGLIVCNYEVVCIELVHKFVYQKDISEHCRRHVVPSVFLGRHVAEANSHILQFSRLDLPYSCFISIRSEAGSNIILFIQLLSEKSLVSCARNSNQLLVYEMEESFGGYWGPLPPTELAQRPPATKFYTLRTTQSTTASTTPSTDVETEEDTVTTQLNMTVQDRKEEGNYIRVEIPIVNVTGRLVPSDGAAAHKVPHYDDTYFDLVYDVKPWRNEKYRTSILPLVQFSNRKPAGARRFGVVEPPRYQLSYGSGAWTPDERLTYPTNRLTSTKTRLYKSRYSTMKRLHFNKLFSARKTTAKLKHLPTKDRQVASIKPSRRQTELIKKPIISTDYNNSWDFVNSYLETVNKDTYFHTTEDLTFNASILLRNIADMEHNTSVYLAPNLTLYSALQNNDTAPSFVMTPPAMISTNINVRGLTKLRNVASYDISKTHWSKGMQEHAESRTNLLQEIINVTPSSTVEDLNRESVNGSLLNNTSQSTENSFEVSTVTEFVDVLKVSSSNLAPNRESFNDLQLKTNRKHVEKNYVMKDIKSTSTVDHESWENVVQAAQVIASLLNQTGDNDNNDTNTDLSLQVNGTSNSSREKRHIHPVPIEDAKPHAMITRKYTPKSTKVTYRIGDLQDFVSVSEPPEDEMHERDSPQYLRHYVTPLMFNICDHTEPTNRQVLLFNSSRIVMILTNFTMDRMTVVVTPARTLQNANGHCSASQLECQVSGARVCIDSMCACDGIPNCGSYEIYDEDRLMCGAALGLQHNVWLAAITFLAVVLTMLYTVHYWLKRCVPKVSQAFFIYTNGGENELYLEPIMRSPYDIDAAYRAIYPSRDNIFDDDIPYIESNGADKKPNRSFDMYIRIFNFFKCKKSKTSIKNSQSLRSQDNVLTNMESKKIDSFTQNEIRKHIDKKSTDAVIQTGDSLEMAYMYKIQNLDRLMRLTAEKVSIKSKQNNPTISQEVVTIPSLNELQPDKQQHKKQSEELNMLKFIKDAGSESTGSVSIDSTNVILKDSFQTSSSDDNEKEIQSHMYHASVFPEPGTSADINNAVDFDISEPAQVRKHLRFDMDATEIPVDGRISVTESKDKRRSFIAGVGKIWRALDLDTVEENEEASSSSVRDQRSFWGGNKKGKKAKKKTSSLR